MSSADHCTKVQSLLKISPNVSIGFELLALNYFYVTNRYRRTSKRG